MAQAFVPVLFLIFARLSPAQVAILHITVVEGEGAVHVPGSRSSRPLTVEITDETGKPVADAAVTFHLPEDGPGGALPNGLRTAVVTTDARGRATLRGFQANRSSGRFQIRIFASKEQARAGTVSLQYIAEAGSGAAGARVSPPIRTEVPPSAPASRIGGASPGSPARDETRPAEPPAREATPRAPHEEASPPRPPAPGAAPATPAPANTRSPSHRTKWFTIVALAGGGAVAGLFAAGRSGRTAQPAAPPTSIGPPTISLGKP